MFVYLDNSATTKQYDEVTELMVECMKNNFGNPSSLHRVGLNAEKLVKNARKQVANAIGVKEDEIIFTSGGTESDNMAIVGMARALKRKGNKIVTTKVEHPAVLESFKKLEDEGFETVYIDVDENYQVDVEKLKKAIDEKTILISVMHVNNETGAINPIEEIAKIKGDALLHVDAVQSFGKLSIPTDGVDLISVSSHKIHGPKGIGALVVKKGLNIKPILVGGGQEKNLRSGTENVPAIVGFGLASELATANLEEKTANMADVRKYLAEKIKDEIEDVSFFTKEQSCPSVLNISFLGTRGEVILHSLETADIYVSTGSACSSNKSGKGSHVLKACNATQKELEGAIRFSFDEFNTIEQMDYVVENLKESVVTFRKLGSFR